jgi:hypothetical protein
MALAKMRPVWAVAGDAMCAVSWGVSGTFLKAPGIVPCSFCIALPLWILPVNLGAVKVGYTLDGL